jgi:hypothetical protein
MPENREPEPSPDNESNAEETTGYANRAERRRRGKGVKSPSTTGKARDTGRHNATQGPRQWTIRHGG